MASNRRDFLLNAGAFGAMLAGNGGAKGPVSKGAALSSAKLFLPPDNFAAAIEDRLPLSWNKDRTRALQARLAAAGYDGVLITDSNHIFYFTGLFFNSTERLFHAFLPINGDHPIWFYPALDRDLVRTWWYEDGEMYFDWLNVEGAAPQEGIVLRGPTQDLWRWNMEGLKKRGFAGKKLAVDTDLDASSQKITAEVLGSPMNSVYGDCIYLRQRKTPEELAMSRRVYAYQDRMQAFARDFVLTHGTDITDYDVTSATTKYGVDLILGDIKHDGRPHSAVGIGFDIECRVGAATAYPHPNQFLYSKMERGKAFQVSTVVSIGGCGGELYRPYMIAPRTDHMEKLWSVNRDCCLMQKELSRKGTECSEVAYAIHRYQVKQGMQKYIYHRPGHGQDGLGSHQSPFIALGDRTVLDTGMCFSVEPGLFDPETGIGSNFSDMFVVEPEGPSLQMSRLPWSEEWSFIKI